MAVSFLSESKAAVSLSYKIISIGRQSSKFQCLRGNPLNTFRPISFGCHCGGVKASCSNVLTSKYFKNTARLRNLGRNGGKLSQKRHLVTANVTVNDEPKDPASERSEFMVTTPLYYVNAAPHMGSAYPTIAADALSRFQRLRGKNVIFVTGTDEHGEKIALAAAFQNKTPKEHVDTVSLDYKDLWQKFNISNDRFIRTTNEKHTKIVIEFFNRVLEKGDIYQAEYEGLYCVACEEYKDEKELLEDNCCPVHIKPCVHRKEENYFFALSKYQKHLEALFEQNPNFVRPSFRKNEVLGWVGEGLRDFSISRSFLDWGIPVPIDSNQTIYVWFDALLGYLTAILESEEEPSLENILSKKFWPASVHIIGKDILRFHAVYWPAMLMSAGLPLPEAVFGHGFLTKDGLKMGKSLGNTLDPAELVQRFGAEAVRFFFLREIEFGRDGDFSETRFINTVNASLANTMGNLLNRTLNLLKKNCGGALPYPSSDIPEDHPLRALARSTVASAESAYSDLSFSVALESALSLATAGNVWLDEQASWSKIKVDRKGAELDLVCILEVCRIVSILLCPVTPLTSNKVYLQLGFTQAQFDSLAWSECEWGGLKEGQQTADPSPVFQRIETEEAGQGTVAEKKPKKKGKQKKDAVPSS